MQNFDKVNATPEATEPKGPADPAGALAGLPSDPNLLLNDLVDELQTALLHQAGDGRLPDEPPASLCDEKSSCIEPEIERKQQLPPPPDPHGLGQRDARLLRQAAVPVAVLIAGIAGVLLPIAATPGSPPAAVLASDASKLDAAASSATSRGPDQEELTATDEGADARSALRPVQEPITPRLVRTIAISATSDQSTAAPLAGLLSPVGKADETALEPGEQVVPGGQPGQAPDPTDLSTEPSGANWTGSATRNASLTERSEPEEAMPGTVKPDAASMPDAGAGPDTSAAEIEDSSASVADAESQPADPTRFAPVSSHANLRSDPASDAAVIRVIPAGARVGVISCANWCEVVFEGERGWVHRTLVTGGSQGGGGGPSAGLQMPAGTPLISADGAQIGAVRSIATDPNGSVFVLVNVAQGLGTGVPVVRLRPEHLVATDQHARLKFTRAKFVSWLQRQARASASAGAVTN